MNNVNNFAKIRGKKYIFIPYSGDMVIFFQKIFTFTLSESTG